MTILDRIEKGDGAEGKKEHAPTSSSVPNAKRETVGKEDNDGSSTEQTLTKLENKFSEMMAEFRSNAGFSVDTGEHAVDTMIEFLGHPSVGVSIVVLLSYIRYCINHGLKKDITVKIGYNKPPSVPMNFAVNEELLEDIYPGDVVEIN